MIYPKDMNNVVQITRDRFSFAWQKFAKKEVRNGWYKDSFSYLKFIPKEIYMGNDKLGLDVGCGSGADMINISQYGAKIIGLDLSDSIRNTYENVKNLRNISIVQADVYNLPFQDAKFDFVYSFGVLHHLYAPEQGFRRLVSKTKKDGFVIIYVYEDFSERSALERFLLKIVNSLRIITTKMSPRLLYLFSIIVSPFILLFCSIPYQLLNRLKVTKKFAEKIPYRHTNNLECIVSDLYDRFSPPIENRYKKEDIEGWFRRAYLEDIRIINYRGWVAWGKKQ